MSKLLQWFSDRTGCDSLCSSWLCRPLPHQARWRSFWGSLLIFNFLVLLITGIFLSTTFSPSSRSAWESVFFIQHHMVLGWFIRGFHHFASQSMVVLIAVFMFQVILDRAYKAPKELLYWCTLGLFLLIVGLAHTGYLLPWDQRGYQAAIVFTNIAGSSPGVGAEVQQVIQGGAEKGNQTITRLYSLHVVILPFLIFCLFIIQQALYRRAFQLQHTTETNSENNAETTDQTEKKKPISAWPDLFLQNSLGMLGLTILLTALTFYFHGAELTGPADPANKFAAARPEWYFLFLFKLLKLSFVEKMGGIIFGAIILPQAILIVFFLMPFIGKSKWGEKFNLGFITVCLIAIAGLTAWTLYEDSNNIDYQHAVEKAHSEAKRVTELALSPSGIPGEGALHLVNSDPLLQGSKLFAARCSSCHYYNGHDGLGNKPKTPATAADLGNFGSREWLRSVLVDYKTVFKPTENAKWNGKLIGNRFLDGDMAAWSEEHQEMLSNPKNKKAVEALIEFLYVQSDPKNAQNIDAKQIKLGKEIYEFGELAGDDEANAFSSTCVDCHTLKTRSNVLLKSEGEAPNLTGYASQKWLTSFLRTPHAEEHYGYTEDANAMPSFQDQLSEKQMSLLVRWMTGDYYRPTKK